MINNLSKLRSLCLRLLPILVWFELFRDRLVDTRVLLEFFFWFLLAFLDPGLPRGHILRLVLVVLTVVSRLLAIFVFFALLLLFLLL